MVSRAVCAMAQIEFSLAVERKVGEAEEEQVACEAQHEDSPWRQPSLPGLYGVELEMTSAVFPSKSGTAIDPCRS